MWFSSHSRHLRKNYHDLGHEAIVKFTGWLFFIGGPIIAMFADSIQHSYQYINGDHPTLYSQQTFMVSFLMGLTFSLLSYPTDLIYKRIKGLRIHRDNPEPKLKNSIRSKTHKA